MKVGGCRMCYSKECLHMFDGHSISCLKHMLDVDILHMLVF
jgi:hypothetical protein